MQQETQIQLDKLTTEQLGAIGWDQRERQDSLRKQIEQIDANLAVIRGELERRNKAAQEAARNAEAKRKADEDALVARVAERVAGSPVNRMAAMEAAGTNGDGN